MVGNDTIRRTAYLRRCIFGILRLPVPHIFRFRLELLPFILLFCDFGRGWRKLQLNFSVKGGKFGLQLLQLVLLLPHLARYLLQLRYLPLQHLVLRLVLVNGGRYLLQRVQEIARGGYHSAYILARFKDGLYNGDYEEYIYNKLKAKGSYKEGWKDGIFRKYDDEGRVTEEKSYKSGKLDGAHRTFYTNGKLEMERFYKEGKQDGKDVYYEFDGTLRREHNYKDGKQTGKQYSYIKGTFELKETSYYNEQGLLDGDFEQLYLFGQPRTTGHYKNGQKDGTWVQIAESGDTLHITT